MNPRTCSFNTFRAAQREDERLRDEDEEDKTEDNNVLFSPQVMRTITRFEGNNTIEEAAAGTLSSLSS
jgi:hypothetical protein